MVEVEIDIGCRVDPVKDLPRLASELGFTIKPSYEDPMHTTAVLALR